MEEIYFHETKSPVLCSEDHYSLREFSKKRPQSNTKTLLRTLGIVVAFFVVGLGLGFWSCKLEKESAPARSSRKEKSKISHQEIVDQIDRKEIETNLRELTQSPHNAASKRNYELAQYLKKRWQEHGIEAKSISYKALLSFPSSTKQSAVYLVTSEGEIMFETQETEKPVEASEREDKVLPPFAAYSPSGNVTAEVIYVNYGRIEDFQYLVKHNVSCEGKIVIVRYGENFRGDKVNLAHDYGAVGVIVFSDPADFAPDSRAGTYPKSKYLPCSGVQRGSFRVANGDPETPGYPSTDGAHRVARDKQHLPKVPVYPISACDAQEILRKLQKVIPTPETWQGGLNILYNIGPGFGKPYDTWRARLEVHNEERREDIFNVIGTIRGEHEPDRRVIIGNHRDAWVFGGVDPSGGTACLMEIARALGRALRNGWRPRRTIMLCSWGAEEYGMIGSTEYAEEFSKTLAEESVAYLNVDSPVRGSYSLFAKSSPMLFDVLFEAAKKVKNPTNEKETLFEQWLKNLPSKAKRSDLPRVGRIATGSDYVAFSQQLGIPCAEIRYVASKNKLGYPVYHSLHDTFNYVKTFIDPTFRLHHAIAQVMIHSVLALAESKVIPMNVTKYSDALTTGVKNLRENYGEILTRHNASFAYLQKAVEMFKSAASRLRRKVLTINKQNDLELRMFNDKITSLEKGFISHVDLTGEWGMRHVIFGLHAKNSYKTVEFPGLTNALMAETKDNSTIEMQMNIVTAHIQSVASYLEEL